MFKRHNEKKIYLCHLVLNQLYQFNDKIDMFIILFAYMSHL